MLTPIRIWISAFPAKMKSIFGFVGRWCDILFALIAFGSFAPYILPVPLAVVFEAKSSCEMLFTTSFANSWRTMNQTVLFLSAAQLKIGNSIVVANLVLMVNLFFRIKKSSNLLLHKNPMLQNVTSTIALWMIWLKNLNVPVRIFVSVSGFKIRSAWHVLDYVTNAVKYNP